MLNNNNYKGSAFTYIELLIVVVIILVVSTISVVAYTTAAREVRDTQRKNDLKQYHIALQAYFGVYFTYPLQGPTVNANSLCTGVFYTPGDPRNLSKFMQVCPVDSLVGRDSSFSYKYTSNVNATQYVLYGKLEDKRGVSWVYCSNGKSGEVAASTVVSWGACPLL